MDDSQGPDGSDTQKEGSQMETTVQGVVQERSREGESSGEAVLGTLWRVAVCAVVYVVGLGVGGALVSLLGLPMPKMPEGVSQEATAVGSLVGGLLLGAVLVPLASRQRGSYPARWAALGAFVYVSFGVNTAIEAAIFTKMGGGIADAAMFLLPCLGVAAVAARLFGSGEQAEPFRAQAWRFFGARRPWQWVWRVLLAVLAFPMIYWFFGMVLMAVRPGLMEYYKSEAFLLTVPGPGVILGVALLRSVLFLVSGLPVMILWRGSRRSLVWALGLALTVLVGAIGMVSVPWWPMEMRIGHGLEIAADSFAHAAVLVGLLVPVSPGRGEVKAA